MTPLISIIIPAYNAAKTIGAAIESAIAQSYRPIEVVVVDDGSRDDTVEVVNKIISSEVRLVCQSNGGASSARNTGIAQARGQWIKFLDADDLLLPDCLSSHWETQKNLGDMKLSVGGFIENGVYRFFPEHSMQVYTPWLPLFSKQALVEAGGFDTSMPYAEDIELCINLRCHGYSFVNFETPVYDYQIGVNPDCITAHRRDWHIIQHFFLKHKDHYHTFATSKEYYRLFIIILFTNKDGLNELYKFLRHEMPFFVHPPQYLYSRVLGYVLWYGGYLFSFAWWHGFLGRHITPSFQSWLQRHKL